MTHKPLTHADNERTRLDKWLWAARFYKTRSLATQACDGGKVQVDGQRAKPSLAMRIGMRVKLRQGYDDKELIVKTLADHRGNATAAQLLYEESAASIAQRELHAVQHQAIRMATPQSDGRPDKKQRRQLLNLKSPFENE
jgi:ribosome-associated heat shock protein Hsp15